MAIVTFTPPINPSTPAGASYTPRVVTVQFGDGYEQRIGDGINTMPEKLSLRWDNIKAADAATIKAFFEARAGVEAFYYTIPGLTARKYKCAAWTVDYQDSSIATVTAKLAEVFDLGT